MIKKLNYSVTQIENNIRYITVFDNGKIMAELECLAGFLSNEEEIQNWLDSNGYGDDVFEFEIIN